MSFINLSPANFTLGGRGVHYAWVMVAVAAAMRLSSSAVRSSFSILVPRLVEVFGWSYGAVGFGLALQWAFSGLFGPGAGWLGDRYGIRLTMLLGAALFVLFMVLTSRMSSLWEFYLFYGVLLSASLAVFQVPLTASLTMWFQRNLGLGMGVLQSSQGMGPLVFVPLVVFIMDWFGQSESGTLLSRWITGASAGGMEAGLRAAFWVTGLAGGVILIALVKVFYNEPAQIGLRPLGAAESEPIRRAHPGGFGQDAGQRVPAPGPADVGLLEPDWDTLLGLRRPRHHPGPAGGDCRRPGSEQGRGGLPVRRPVGGQHHHPVRRSHRGGTHREQGSHGHLLLPAKRAHAAAVLRPRRLDVLPVRRAVRGGVRRGDERLSHHQPPVLPATRP